MPISKCTIPSYEDICIMLNIIVYTQLSTYMLIILINRKSYFSARPLFYLNYGNARFTTVPLKALFDQVKIR